MDVVRVVDLAHPIEAGMPVYPGDPEVGLTAAATVEADGCNLLRVEMGSQTGTHVDAPFHVRADGARLDELDPALFTGVGVLADVTGRPPRAPLTWEDLAPVAGGLRPGRILLLRTGWDRHWGTPAYFDHPYLAPDAARRVMDTGVRVIGLDAPSIDPSGQDAPAEPDALPGPETPAEPATSDASAPAGAHPALPSHHVVAGAGGVIAENLTGLGGIDFPEPLITLLPLPLAGADGGPARAAALRLRA